MLVTNLHSTLNFLWVQKYYLSMEYKSRSSMWMDNHKVLCSVIYGNVIHSIAVNFKDPLTFNAPEIWGHKTVRHHLSYLLFHHISKLFHHFFSPFLWDSSLGWFQALLNVLASSSMVNLSSATMTIVVRFTKKINFPSQHFSFSLLCNFFYIFIKENLQILNCSHHFLNLEWS